ncbi:MAG: TonB family protein [Candidatus Aminicenantes bacterium]|jgi:TonB family protein
MKNKLSQRTVTISVLIFTLTLSSPLLAFEKSIPQQSETAELIKAGKELYENGEYKEAIIMFLTALTKNPSVDELSEAYFNLSLAYFADGQSQNAEEYLQKMFEIQPDKTIDERYYPLSFVELFNRLKPEPKTEPKIKPEPEKKPPLKTQPEVETKPERKTEAVSKIEEQKAKETLPPVKEGDLLPLDQVDIPPESIKRVNPEYPAVAKRMNIQGTVIINALISEKGDVIDTAIIRGIEGPFRLNEAAQKAVQKWKFKPAMKGNKAVKVWKPIAIKFAEKRANL